MTGIGKQFFQSAMFAAFLLLSASAQTCSGKGRAI